MTDLTAVSLFAGIGGIDLALKRAGVRVVAAVEIDPACRDILRRHYPETVIFNDVTEVTGDQLRAAGFVPGRGIMAGGWPCQGNSVAGRRGGMADPRSGLWMHVARLLAELHPRWFLGENVPGLLSVNGGRDLAVVRRDLAQLGYWWAERILDAQYFGVPQRRRRIFFVGGLGDPAGPVQVLLEPEGGQGNPAPGGTPRPGTTSAANGGADEAGRPAGEPVIFQDSQYGVAGYSTAGSLRAGRIPEHQMLTVSALQGGGRRGHRIDAEGAAGGHLIAHAITAREGKGPDSDASTGFVLASFPVALRGRDEGGQIECGDDDSPAFAGRTPGGGGSYPMVATFGGEGVTHALTSEGADASEDGTGRGTPIVAVPMAFNPQTGGSAGRLGWAAKPTALQASQITAIHMAVGFAENQRGELVESEVSHQLTTGGGKPGQGFLADRQEALVRRLTPTECERLQGFPDGWTDGQADATRYRQLGNSVAVPCVEWITGRLVATDSILAINQPDTAA